MLLIVYSFININNVSWGTREVVPTATEQQQAQQEAQQQRRKSIVDKVFDVFRGNHHKLHVVNIIYIYYNCIF